MALRTPRASTSALALLLGLLGSCAEEARPDQPNVVLITVDTLRADHLGPYGYERDTSPFLDDFARESIVFENAVSQCGTTPQSLSSLMTGLYPYADGIVTQNDRFVYLVRGNQTLAEVLRRRGYRTHAVSSSIQAHPATGLDLGFESFEGASFDHATGAKRQVRAEELSDRAIRWLEGYEESGDERPFFLWLHYIDPHEPYQPPEEYAGLWADEEQDTFDGELRYYRFDGEKQMEYPLHDGELTNWILNYDREIRFVDDQLERLFEQALNAHLEDTLIVFASDHGEGLGEHKLIDHNDIFESVLHVPLLMRLPGGQRDPATEPAHDPARGARVSQGVMLVDVFPTVLDLLQVGLPGPVRGTSLRPLWEGGGVDDERLRLGEYPDHRAIYYRDFKLVERTLGDETRRWLFNVARDGLETRDISERRKALPGRLLERSASELYAESYGVDPAGTELPPVTPEMLQELTDLGY